MLVRRVLVLLVFLCVSASVQAQSSAASFGQAIRVPRLDGVDAAVVGLMDHGAMMIEPGKAGAWTGAMVSETGRVLATCDSAWPRQGKDQSVCRLQ